MRRTSLTMAFVTLMTLAGASAARAQLFGPGYTDIGPIVGFGGLSGASLALGGRFEHGIKKLPDVGNGTIAIQIGVDYFPRSRGVSTLGSPRVILRLLGEMASLWRDLR